MRSYQSKMWKYKKWIQGFQSVFHVEKYNEKCQMLKNGRLHSVGCVRKAKCKMLTVKAVAKASIVFSCRCVHSTISAPHRYFSSGYRSVLLTELCCAASLKIPESVLLIDLYCAALKIAEFQITLDCIEHTAVSTLLYLVQKYQIFMQNVNCWEC